MTISFSDFFRALWGRDPFPWQQRLADCVVSGGWPDVLGVPTGCGKTSAIDIAVWHLAIAERGDAPRRVVFVVDRRLVVDAAHTRALAIAEALRTASPGSTLAMVAQRLLAHSGLTADPGAEPLAVMRWRGGVPREPSTLLSPVQPVVIASTVDQVGSRLLFRGYGLSPAMAPIHAGLLAFDSLVLLDEAHLAEPFRQTATRIATLVAPAAEAIGVRPLRPVLLSATPGAATANRFDIDEADRAHPVLSARLGAQKVARLVAVRDRDEELVSTLAKEARAHLAAGAGTVLVVANRVATARAVHDALSSAAADADLELLIGPSRPLDRADRVAQWLPRLLAGRDDAGAPRAGPRPLVLVATQCIEVGVDIDVDALVSESAPLDALRQRAGRLDRLGRLAPGSLPRATIVHRERKDPDEIYGERIAATWAWLRGNGGDPQTTADLGVSAIEGAISLLEPAAIAALECERPDAPLLLPHHVEAFAESSTPGPAPTAAPFLHGPAGVPGVRVAWRSDLSWSERAAVPDVRRDQRLLDLLPPAAGELLEVRPWALRRWLEGGQAGLSTSEGDVAVLLDDEERNGQRSTTTVWVLRWEGDFGWAAIPSSGIRPGDTLVLPAGYGGCDQFGWAPASAVPVRDLTEEAVSTQQGVAVRRLHPALLSAEQWAAVQPLLAEFAAGGSSLVDALRARLPALLPDGVVTMHAYDPGAPESGVIVIARGGVVDTVAGSSPSTESDVGSFSAAIATLDDHTRAVVEWARFGAEALALGEPERRAIELAAQWHDVGKADAAFQAMLRGEARLSRFDARPLLAKSSGAWDPGAAARAGLPDGWRHELLSVVLAEPQLADECGSVRDLALWLIATHHGRGRLVFDDVAATSAPDRSVEVLGHRLRTVSGELARQVQPAHAERWQRLRARYGEFGLALLEAVLRLADHRASSIGRGPEVA